VRRAAFNAPVACGVVESGGSEALLVACLVCMVFVEKDALMRWAACLMHSSRIALLGFPHRCRSPAYATPG
jgi:hypothetical protein